MHDDEGWAAEVHEEAEEDADDACGICGAAMVPYVSTVTTRAISAGELWRLKLLGTPARRAASTMPACGGAAAG